MKMGKLKCCAECFSDRHLKLNTIPSISTEVGKCPMCETDDTQLVPANALEELFSPLITIYVEDENGQPLVHWLRDDWGMFVHPKMDESRSMRLLGEILDNGEIARKSFSPSPQYANADGLKRWEELRNELMYTNRFFPDTNLDDGRLPSLFDQLVSDEFPNTWFRARLMQGEAPYPIEEMGAPPKRIASHGRANPPGIPYLYLGSTEETAISEIRPHTGELACVGEFILNSRPPEKSRKLVDLRDPRALISPFVYGDEDKIGQLRADVLFLARLGEELTRPVLPQGAAIDYVPSQYLCELIKKSGNDGVVYRSSVSDGINLALFDPADAEAQSVYIRRVAKVSVAISNM